MDQRELLRTAIAGAVGAVRRGDEDDALVRFGRLAGSTGLTLRDSVLELAEANVEMLMALVDEDTGPEPLVVLAEEDADGEAASIDETEPAQRATTRVLLALANGHHEDAEMQLDIVAAAPDPNETGHVLAHTMSWTLELLDMCTDAGRPVPGWLRPVLT
jgi:ATP phosphoribosyltransferase regulatory subunit HisZ